MSQLRSHDTFIFLFLIYVIPSIQGASLSLNEVLTSNKVTLYDEDGDSPDWIELYNSGDELCNLNGYGLSDDPGKPFKWIFPAIVVYPRCYLLVFASGKNRRAVGGALHTNFKLNADGEALILSPPNGATPERLDLPPLPVDVSWGRLPDGDGIWAILSAATPGAPNNVRTTLAPPKLLTISGFYDFPITVQFNSVPQPEIIRYTLDGSLPNENSPIYQFPIPLDTTAVIRAAVFADHADSSPVTTATFFINEHSTFPIVSLTTDPYNLWDLDYGIYTKGRSYKPVYPYKGANFWREWERPVHIEFFEPTGALGFQANGGVRIFGHWSAAAPFKPLALYARRQYGEGKFSYQIFPNKPIYEFEAFMLRNSGNDWNRTLFRDAVIHAIASEIGMPTQAYRPALLFLNGRYWGIHNLRERMNEHYLASNFNVNPDSVDLIAYNYGFVVYAGDSLNYISLRNFVQRQDLALADNYNVVNQWIDIDNFIDYLIVEIYFANRDWPHNNQHMWRPRRSDGRWQWLIKDVDYGFGYASPVDINTFRINALKHDLFPFLLKNEHFKNRFLNRFAYLMCTLLQPEHIFHHLDEKKQRLELEMPRHLARWAGTEDYGDPPQNMMEWLQYVQELYDFARERMPHVKDDLIEYFKLHGLATLTVTVNDSTAGYVQIEGWKLPRSFFSGDFFQDVPLTLSAHPAPGYVFGGWKGIDTGENSLTLTLHQNCQLEASFLKQNDLSGDIVINEINYHSSWRYPVCDWIELINQGDIAVDLSGWSLNFGEAHAQMLRFPPKTILSGGALMIIAADSADFHRFYPAVDCRLLFCPFNLSADDNTIRLLTADGSLADSLSFTSRFPWPAAPNGKGPTLALTSASLDNSVAVNWISSVPLGTPGKQNISEISECVVDWKGSSHHHQQQVMLTWSISPSISPFLLTLQKRAGGEWLSIAYGDNILYRDNHFTYLDPTICDTDTILEYRLVIHQNEESVVPSGGGLKIRTLPELLLSNYPNPFNIDTLFLFTSTRASKVSLTIYDLRGRLVDQLLNQTMDAGNHTIKWNAGSLPSGIYFCRLSLDGESIARKIILQK